MRKLPNHHALQSPLLRAIKFRIEDGLPASKDKLPVANMEAYVRSKER